MNSEMLMNRDLVSYKGVFSMVQEIAGKKYLRPVEGLTDIGAGAGEMIEITKDVADLLGNIYRALPLKP